MKFRALFRSADAAGVLPFLFLLSSAHSQNRPPQVSSTLASSHTSVLHAVQPSADEQALFDAANRERAALHLQRLEWDSLLAVAAHQHALAMTREHELSHQYPGELPLDQRAAQAGARFAEIAENIAFGSTAQEIHDGWMHSPGHRKNILNPEVSALGISVVLARDGLFAVQDFSHPVPDLNLEQQEQKVIVLMSPFGLRTVEATDDARKTCAASKGFSGARPSAVFHLETADLSKLPDEVSKAVRSRDYRRAAVGACAATQATGFVRFRFALLLY
jgi:uncharacterized protein YkwD